MRARGGCDGWKVHARRAPNSNNEVEDEGWGKTDL